MTAIASLPMYDWPEVKRHTDALWHGFARHAGLRGELDRETVYNHVWRNETMVFSQMCGYHIAHEFRHSHKILATPHYEADGCSGPTYCSFILARDKQPLENFRGAKAAINSPDSMSGYVALKAMFAPLAVKAKFFASALQTGSHLASIHALQKGEADIAAIDAVCVALARKYRPEIMQGLHIVSQSPQVPSLPFVTRVGDVSHLRAALFKTFADAELASARQALFLRDISVLGQNDYEIIRELEARSVLEL